MVLHPDGHLNWLLMVAEDLLLHEQLALYQERQGSPQRASDATRVAMGLPARLFDWKKALVAVRPETFTEWHRKGFRLLWLWRSRSVGRPRIPKDLRHLILTTALENSTWVKKELQPNFLSSLRFRSHLVRSGSICRRSRRKAYVLRFHPIAG